MIPIALLLYAITNLQTLKLIQIDSLHPPPGLLPQKHVPITLVGIPYVSLYTLLGVVRSKRTAVVRSRRTAGDMSKRAAGVRSRRGSRC